MTKSERRFINQWSEQRSGTRKAYYIQFTIAWTVVAFLVLFFLTKLFTTLWETGGKYLIIFLAVAGILIGFVATHLNYTICQKRYKKILEREQKNEELKMRN